MSRTAHHASRSRSSVGYVPGGPWRSVMLADLRYSAACLTEASRAGHRPTPELVRRKTVVYSWARADPHDRSVSRWANIEESQTRQRLRRLISAIRQTVNATAGGASAIEAADDLDVPPARHRRGAVWLA
ncbi:hypothetical protein Aph01nite_27710 [Acrocarpospora phusangensis]|uniref:Uncharacterized protein n=1 Tax=Acrocarpospora phusangensis TaxID=1070424 RepID=A0A919Q929_9ACTN|nr:hypothetical protein Aph01nite_27710 [Acrocarpospora phusangensis]